MSTRQMSWAVLVAGVGAAAVMAGCDKKASPVTGKPVAAAASAPTTASCPPPLKQVTINQITVSGATATIKVNPGARDIPNTGGGVQWKFSGNAYNFTADGVNFVKPNYPSQPASGPSSSGFGSDATEFVVCFVDTTALGNVEWHYNIKFFATATPATIWICDPTIVNHGSGISTDDVQDVNCTIAP